MTFCVFSHHLIPFQILFPYDEIGIMLSIYSYLLPIKRMVHKTYGEHLSPSYHIFYIDGYIFLELHFLFCTINLILDMICRMSILVSLVLCFVVCSISRYSSPKSRVPPSCVPFGGGVTSFFILKIGDKKKRSGSAVA